MAKKQQLETVRELLLANQEGAVVQLGRAALGALQRLAVDDDLLVASRAVRMAGVIGGRKGMGIVSDAARSRDHVLRVAAAVIASEMGSVGQSILDRLKKSRNAGVRKWARRRDEPADACRPDEG